MEELCNLGCHTFVRVGTCGGIKLEVQSDDVVVATGAVRMEGTSREYAPSSGPLSPTYGHSALVQAAQNLGKPWHAGVVQCKDSFYGQHSPARMPVSYELEQKWEHGSAWACWPVRWNRPPCLPWPPQGAVRCGSVFHVIWNQEREKAGLDQKENEDVTLSVKLAIER